MRTHSQRLLSMVLALSMLLTFLPVSAFAENTPPPYEVSQPRNNDYTYTDSSSNSYQYTLNPDGTATLTKFTGTVADVPSSVIANDGTSYTVTAIGENAFGDEEHSRFNPTLISVNLPDSIQTIGHGAFYGCSSLHKIILPKGLVTVGHGAFAMAGLTEVTLPKSLKKVGESAFASVPAIQTVTYTGTIEDWNKLVNSADFGDYNTQLTDVTPHCAHTVTFDMNGHGDPKKELVQYNDPTTPISDPTANGYKFMGWYTESEGGTEFDFGAEITEDKTAYAHWEKEKEPAPTPEQPGTPEKPNEPTDKPNEPTTPEQPGTPEKPNEPTTPEVPTVEEDDTAAIGYAAAAVTVAFVGWGAYRIGSEVYLKYLLPKDVLLPQNRIQLAKLLWEDAGRPAPADAAAYADVDANDADAQQAARWAVENGLLTLPDTEKPEEFAPYRSVSYAKSARAWNQAQQLKETAAAR